MRLNKGEPILEETLNTSSQFIISPVNGVDTGRQVKYAGRVRSPYLTTPDRNSQVFYFAEIDTLD